MWLFFLFFVLVIFIFLLHSIIPTYYPKFFSPPAFFHTDKENQLLLTFDDGPDERYTNQLLDVLKQHSISATFFVVAQNAQKHPQIIKRMQEENHVIGLHSLAHKNAMFHSFRYTKKDFKESYSIMESLGCEITYYRPPWGHLNLFSAYHLKKFKLKLMLWDVMAEDWSKKATIDSIIAKLLARVKHGSIICLHDAGENSGGAKDAPLKTIAALQQAIPLLQGKGYEFITPEGLFS